MVRIAASSSWLNASKMLIRYARVLSLTSNL